MALAVNAAKQHLKTPLSQKYRFWASLFGLLPMLIGALFISIITEWIGLLFWWEDEGVGHSLAMVAVESGYLNGDFKKGLFGLSPVEAILHGADSAYFWVFEWTSLDNGLRWLGL